MDWKKEKLQSIWKVNKEKLIFLFCSGLLLFILALPNEGPAQRAASESVAAGQGASSPYSAGDSTQTSVPPSGGGGSYEKELEERIQTLLSGVDGVGEVEVLVILKSSEEKILHVDQNTSSSVTEETNADGTGRVVRQQELSESTVLEGQASAPVVEKELMPEISGIVISADGGGSAVVRAEISEAMEALFGLPSHKIKVLKRVKKGA
ncbi:MAG: stage III sporulation protein AG [Lachnospiraceae bacterium]|nr:stage III sporulation protein AG [Lachnospiraceae bacterium]